MAPAIVEAAEQLWETWNIRICILLSLFIQACLTFLAPWRKRSKKMRLVIWMLYLLADAIALYTIGLISNISVTKATNRILVFWSPFLLVHLGGPDTITALALEDNELWLRHLLQLGTQSAGTFSLFYKSFRTKLGYDLLIPALVMYVNGCVKYLERTNSLYMASMGTFRESLIGKPNAGPNYAGLMEEYASRKAAHIPVDIITTHDTGSEVQSEGIDIPVDDEDTLAGDYQTESGDQGTVKKEMKLVKQAYEFYVKFRGLIADIMFTFKERNESRDFFLKKIKNGEEAFKVIQIELNFFYDVFFTKNNTLQKARGITRVFSIAAVIACFLLFHFRNTLKYRTIDLCITYVLLGGAFIMDMIAIVMLFFSDWAIVAAYDNIKGRCKPPLATHVLDYWLRHHPPRWSEVISQYDLFYYCLNEPLVLKMLLFKRVKDMAENFLYVSESKFDHNIENIIFKEIKTKAKAAVSTHDAKKACEARGDLVFARDDSAKPFDDDGYYAKTLRQWTLDVDYDESVMLWHMATTLCIWNENLGDKTRKSVLAYQKFSKVIGCYMMYLLTINPSMTSSVTGIAQVRFQDTCDEVKKFIRRKLPQEEIGKIAKFKLFVRYLARLPIRFFQWLLSRVRHLKMCRSCYGWCKKSTVPPDEVKQSKLEDERLRQVCKRILAVNTEKKPVEVKGDRSKSVMFDACRLAKKLIGIREIDGEKKQWELIAKVWVELLCYAANRSKPTAHVAQLREGGELISLVWLLMAHFGLGEQFRINKGTGWAKLAVEK